MTIWDFMSNNPVLTFFLAGTLVGGIVAIARAFNKME